MGSKGMISHKDTKARREDRPLPLWLGVGECALQTYQLDLRNKVKIGCVEGKERQLPGNCCRSDKGVWDLQIMTFGITFDEIPGEGRDCFVNLNDLIILKGFFNASDLMQI
jgi:hypothetical protein